MSIQLLLDTHKYVIYMTKLLRKDKRLFYIICVLVLLFPCTNYNNNYNNLIITIIVSRVERLVTMSMNNDR
jgi:hypothetical protein